jgi:glucose/arabinose dehydrogenase
MRTAFPGLLALFAASLGLAATAEPDNAASVLEGAAAFGDWSRDRPGTIRHIRASDLPPPYATRPAAHSPRVVPMPAETKPHVPPGFDVALFAHGLAGPRTLRTAPNGDIFVAETQANRVRVLRARDGASSPSASKVFAAGLDGPFGIAFYPPGPDPKWVYVANTDSVVRFPYRAGDLKARTKPETIIPHLPRGGHSTRDIAFAKDGARMFVSVGSSSNVAEDLPAKSPAEAEAWDREHHALGAAWGEEADRADVLVADPDGRNLRIFATGIRNCVGLAVNPTTGDPWCSTNERDGLGDDLVPDYVTRVKEGAFYGWPWTYIGDHADPRHMGERLDLAGKANIPDVLLQPHSASLGLTFYDRGMFPASYRGSAFAAEHGSWNRSKPTGYKVIRILVKDGVPTGEYEDFMTGFVLDDDRVVGRPVGVTVARDGALLVSEDGNGTIWRVSRKPTN